MTLRITESKLAANRKDRTMIKVMIERHVKKGEGISPLLRDLRDVAMRQPGYITGETIVVSGGIFGAFDVGQADFIRKKG